MFDIGFSEVLLIFVIALVVLGPEKLPRVASQVGRWIGRARSMARQFREQLEEEVNLEQVRKAHEKKPTPTPGTQSEASSSDPSATTSPSGTPSDGSTSSPSTGTVPDDQAQGTSSVGVGSYHGPDPADFRADTFSHAHPTNEYGANPHTSNGAAEESARTASEANVAAAQPQPEATTDKRAASSEAYAPSRPRDNTPGTDNHGN